MFLEAIYHKPYSEYAFPIDENTLAVRIRAKKGDLNNVTLYYHDKYDNSLHGSILMSKGAVDELYDYFETSLNVGIKRFKYMFCLEDDDCTKWYNANGFSDYKPEWSFFSYSNICKADVFEIPDWLMKSVVYQIFPDRFHNPSCTGSSGINSKSKIHSRFGGTLKGIRDKIDYLINLGINVIYLNPVFKSNSYHRYDTIDYYEIDPYLGGNDELKKLVDVCHENKIRVILDGVFNHCGADFFAFKDVCAKGECSKYKDWFIIRDFPVKSFPKSNYECFATFGGMPKFNTSNKETMEYLLGVAVYWIENYEIDGWRFDVADEIDRKFWYKLRNKVKEVKKDAVIIGEIWDDASSWMEGAQFDSVINYPLKSLINDLIAYQSVDVQTFKQKNDGYRMHFHSDAINGLINIIGSHDTPRFLTLCAENRKRFELGMVLQFTLPGVPLIYYGDEIGMIGGGDPECRNPMIWDKVGWNKDLLKTSKFLICIRKKNKAFTKGKLQWLEVDGAKEMLAFIRKGAQADILVMMNTSEKKVEGQIKLEHEIKAVVDLKNNEQYTGNGSKLIVRLEPFEWHVYSIDHKDNQV